jgi:hypothetical protein
MSRRVKPGSFQLLATSAIPPAIVISARWVEAIGGSRVRLTCRGPAGLRATEDSPGGERQNPGRIEPARDDERRIVGSIVPAMKGLQRLEGHGLHVTARADDFASVAVPDVAQPLQRAHEHLSRLLVRVLQFVAHHRHFGREIGPGETGGG